jgi:hypothetical protein
LSAIESESVDVVTTRSVLIYVNDKPKASFRQGETTRPLRRKGKRCVSKGRRVTIKLKAPLQNLMRSTSSSEISSLVRSYSFVVRGD